MDRTKTKIDVKLALAEKYERLARLTSSDPKRRHFHHRALCYRRQVEQMRRDG